MQPERLVLLTHCIRSAYLDGKKDEATLLHAERHRAIEQMVNDKQKLSLEERLAIQEADDMLMEILKKMKADVVSKIRQNGLKKRVRNAYRGA